ncbi:MAG: hypothetical protein NWE79_09335 [Candidatus Bathyarchaeota archaeon]|nr:hypothetical protein [Candidatus Bathyarchaeota archaeon]
MRKTFVRCPYCEEQRREEECPLAVSKEPREDRINIYCCETMSRKGEEE